MDSHNNSRASSNHHPAHSSSRHNFHHQGHGGGGSRRPTHGNRQEAGVDMICKVKYTNTLPDLPFEPKFLQSPFISLNRFVNYKPSTLEKNFKYELLTEPDLNVKIDLINLNAYKVDPNEKPPMDPADEELVEDEAISQLNTKRSIQHRKVVPWMRKTEYISTEFNRYGLGQTGLDRPDTKVGYGSMKKVKEEAFEYKDRASQIGAIEKTFNDAKKPIRKHYSRPGVQAVEEFQIFPDFEMWKYPFAQVIFDADPLPYCKTNRQEKLEQAILRGMADTEGNQFVGYFSPFDDALQQRLADDREERGSYLEKFEYQYKLEREYNWAVQNKASKGYEQENYFLIRRQNAFYYNELETRVKLARRVKSSSATGAKETTLCVINRQLNSKELAQMNRRSRMLFAIPEEEEEEEAEEGEEEEEGVEGQQQEEQEENGGNGQAAVQEDEEPMEEGNEDGAGNGHETEEDDGVEQRNGAKGEKRMAAAQSANGGGGEEEAGKSTEESSTAESTEEESSEEEEEEEEEN